MDAAAGGDASAADKLFATLYAELHRMAKRELARQGMPMSLGATTLLHKAYIQFATQNEPDFPDRARFMSYAARVMRGIIIDHARNRFAQKRGGMFEITSIKTDVETAPNDRELVLFSDALDDLAQVEPLLSEVVDLRFFCGFTFAEIAAIKSCSERTAQRHWEKARIYLYKKIRKNLAV